jgi:lipoprotein signal peptidase
MPAIAAFLKPTKHKLVFLVEWALFILFEAVKGELETPQQVLVAVYPLLFFYLVACALAAISQGVQPIARSGKLLSITGGLVVLDQVIKVIVSAVIPYQASIPIVEGWLHLAHERNLSGSWIVSEFNLQGGSFLSLALWGLTVIILIFSVLWHRYYVTTHRRSLWADSAFLGLFAGLSSWMCDMFFRGYILDYIGLPGLVSADLKDIYITVGLAAFFVELLENPRLSWCWAGWREEKGAMNRFFTFTLQSFRGAFQAVMHVFRKPARPE